jgi:Uncharacterized protein conserved in bacteria (DUF2252)
MRLDAGAHARSGDRIAIAAYLGKSDRFDQAITEFAAAYADRNERDHQALVQSIADGKIAAVAGVWRPNAIPGCRLAPVPEDADQC